MIALFTVIAGANGILLGICRLINASLGMRIGSMRGSLVNHFVGAIFAGILLVIGMGKGGLHITGVPSQYFLGGCLGVFVVYINNYAIPYIGATLVVVLMITFQLLTSLVIDHFGLFGAEIIELNSIRLIGIVVLICGAILVFVKRES